MPISPKKLVDHLAWRIAEEAQQHLLKAMEKLLAVKAAFVAQDPDLTGTVLEGKVSDVNAWFIKLQAVCNDSIVTHCIANKSSRRKPPSALGEDL